MPFTAFAYECGEDILGKAEGEKVQPSRRVMRSVCK